MYAEAARCGNIECLDLLHSVGCPRDMSAYTWAAMNGHLKCVEYLYATGCPMREPVHNIYKAAVIGGRLSILRFFHDHGAPYNILVTDAARPSIGRHTLNHHRSDPPLVLLNSELGPIGAAIIYDRFEAMQYLLEIGYPAYDLDMRFAAAYSFKFLAYLHEHGSPMTEQLCCDAITTDNLESLDYLYKLGIHFPSNACHLAVGAGASESLEYLHDHGFAWGDDLYDGIIDIHMDPDCRAYIERVEGPPYTKRTT